MLLTTSTKHHAFLDFHLRGLICAILSAWWISSYLSLVLAVDGGSRLGRYISSIACLANHPVINCTSYWMWSLEKGSQWWGMWSLDKGSHRDGERETSTSFGFGIDFIFSLTMPSKNFSPYHLVALLKREVQPNRNHWFSAWGNRLRTSLHGIIALEKLFSKQPSRFSKKKKFNWVVTTDSQLLIYPRLRLLKCSRFYNCYKLCSL